MATKKATPKKATSKKDKAEESIVLKCADCGSEVSGTDEADVKATMDRHYRGTGHSARHEALPPPPPSFPATSFPATSSFTGEGSSY